MIIDYQITSGDDGKIVKIDSSNGIVNVKLPSPTAGFKVTIKDFSGSSSINRIYIIRNGSELIDGVDADTSLDENFIAVSFIADGTNWSRFDSLHGQDVARSGRGLFGGGATGGGSTVSNVIDFVTISTAAIATDFGDLSSGKYAIASCASTIRGFWAGGDPTSGGGSPDSNVIDYVVIATAANTADFGDLTVTIEGAAGCSNNTRGIFGGGYAGGYSNVIGHLALTTLGNAASFGTLTVARERPGACSSSVRGVFGGGEKSGGVAAGEMDFITIATTGNATSFGSLSVNRTFVAACSSPVRGIFGGGSTGANSNVIDYITIATASGAIDFGDLTVARRGAGACSSALRGLFGGGNTGSDSLVIDYVTISTLGNATSFNNLTVARLGLAACSSSHGGLYV